MDIGTELEIILRIFVAAVLGAGIGVQRAMARKPAGIRTHALICLGAALFTSVAEGFETVQGFDPSRVAAGVVTGIGFVGAGGIIRSQGGRLEGVTTAAGMWATAGIGIAVGTGLYIIGTFSAFLAGSILAIKMYKERIPD